MTSGLAVPASGPPNHRARRADGVSVNAAGPNVAARASARARASMSVAWTSSRVGSAPCAPAHSSAETAIVTGSSPLEQPALQAVTGYTFLAGRLHLSGGDAAERHTILFTKR